MPNYRSIALTLAAALLCAAGEARALTQFDLGLAGPDWDDPQITVTNTSTAGETITDLSISIGNGAYNFDFVHPADPSEAATGATLVSPNRADDDWWVIGGESNSVVWAFTDFQAGESLVFNVDIDWDLAVFFGSIEDARAVLFNNDFFIFSVANAVATATFSDGSVASITLPDGAWAGAYAFSSGAGSGGSGGASSVPEPSVYALVGIGLLGLAWLGEPRRPAAP